MSPAMSLLMARSYTALKTALVSWFRSISSMLFNMTPVLTTPLSYFLGRQLISIKIILSMKSCMCGYFSVKVISAMAPIEWPINVSLLFLPKPC